LTELNFKTSSTILSLFIKSYHNGDKIYVLNYVDNMLYYGNNEKLIKEFEQSLQQRFNLELMGQAHWYFPRGSTNSATTTSSLTKAGIARPSSRNISTQLLPNKILPSTQHPYL
jgi:hypothetical protein